MRYFILCLYFIASPVLAIYDLVSLEVIPGNEQTEFCFHVDGSEKEMYIALQTGQEFSFLDEQGFNSLDEQSSAPSGSETPLVFLTKKIRPTCVGPVSNNTLQNIKLFAGAGSSLDDIAANQKYIQFFNGFPLLSKDEKAWTVMVYIVGSDLEKSVSSGGSAIKGYGSKDILEMLEGTLQPNNNNVVISTGGSSRTGWKTIKRSLIQSGRQYVLEDLGSSQNMASPQALSDFVIWAKNEFPAQHYALILWDHGGGTQGFAQDSSSSGSKEMMSFIELNQAYLTISKQITAPLDIAVYDACLMATMEVAEITAGIADAMSGSAELEPGHGIDYAHLLKNTGANPPNNGLEFANIVKAGFIQQTKDKGTFDSSQITYSIFDLTKLPTVTEAFQQFATEFNNVLTKTEFLNDNDYEALSRGLIRAPGYPVIQTGKLSSLHAAAGNEHVRVDFYNLLQNFANSSADFNQSARALLENLQQMVVAHEINDNVREIDAEAGRLSLDIGLDNTAHLSVLPGAYSQFNNALSYYDYRRQQDTSIPKKELVCPDGVVCAFAQWLELSSKEVLGIEIYFGQQATTADEIDIYRVNRGFYKYKGQVNSDIELGVDGHKACQYQLCVDDQNCRKITLTERGNRLLADVLLNDSPAILSFCSANETAWPVCGVAQQVDGVWGRDDRLYPENTIIPNTLHLSDSVFAERQGEVLVVEGEVLVVEGEVLVVEDVAQVALNKSCDTSKGVVSAAYYGNNSRRNFHRLCDSGDCICKENDTDEGCQRLGVKIGARITASDNVITVKPQLIVSLNNNIYHANDNMQFNITASGNGNVDLYASIAFPEGYFFTIAPPLNVSQMNEFLPYKANMQLNGEQFFNILNLALPAISPGEYSVCGLLVSAQSDPLDEAGRLDYKCKIFNFQ